jgi:hypothetical protein
LVVPLKVIVVVPLMFVKFTTFVPLILKTPVVENVTGSALTSAASKAPIDTSKAAMTKTLAMLDMILLLPFSSVPPANTVAGGDASVVR